MFKLQTKKPEHRSRGLIGLAGLLALVFLLKSLGGGGSVKQVPLSQILTQARTHQVARADLNDNSFVVTVKLKDGKEETAGYALGYGVNLTNLFLADRVRLSAVSAQGASLDGYLLSLLPYLGILGFGAWYILRGGIAGSLGSKRSKVAEVPDTRFTDVAGVEEAVEELREVVDFLHSPERFRAAGARASKGILLVGPPGTGKTLLARAVAGEAGVPFFAMSGSDFVEMFVGLGAKRVRDLFDKARKAGKAIIFIDEIDSVGKVRSGGRHPATDERENTLNMLLAEMDGFDQSAQIVMLAATNMPEALDPALRRPGRFDREVPVPVPDVGGREKILRLEAQKPGRRLEAAVNLVALARRTFGLTGADLAQVMNEAAMETARRGKTVIGQGEIDAALATTMLGRERRSAVVTEEDRQITAHHEAGHTVAAFVQDAAHDPVSVSIVPRGPAGGVTWMSGTDNVFLRRSEARAQLVVSLAGRAAEELLLAGDYTQGAQGDLMAATDLATKMVSQYGMGARSLLALSGDRLSFGAAADAVNAEVDALLQDARRGALTLLNQYSDLHRAITLALLAEETLDGEALARIRTAVEGGAGPEDAARLASPQAT